MIRALSSGVWPESALTFINALPARITCASSGEPGEGDDGGEAVNDIDGAGEGTPGLTTGDAVEVPGVGAAEKEGDGDGMVTAGDGVTGSCTADGEGLAAAGVSAVGVGTGEGATA